MDWSPTKGLAEVQTCWGSLAVKVAAEDLDRETVG
jgi:hypothetical protein